MDEPAPIDYNGPYVMPQTGLSIPEGIVPRDPYTQKVLLRAADQWWSGLTDAQKLGLAVQYQ